MRLLIASDKFKGSLSAAEACEAIQMGLENFGGGALDFTAIPIADGGEGMAAAIMEAKGGEWIEADSEDALGRPIRAGYGWIEKESLAVIEMAEAAGLWRLTENERDPWAASTYGVGLLIRHAIRKGAARILMGIGGSATNDGGSGMARALGYRFVDLDGNDTLTIPAELEAATSIDAETAEPTPHVMVACDVTNPVLGESGCTPVYGPQKGIADSDFERHERRLAHLIHLTGSFGFKAAETPGAGAAGGLGFGCMAFLNAELSPGFDLVAEILDLESAVENCDLVITGEGRLDSQTLQGKGPAGVAALARKHGKPTTAFAGVIESGSEKILRSAFDAIIQIAPEKMPVSQSMTRGAEFLSDAARKNAEKILSLA